MVRFTVALRYMGYVVRFWVFGSLVLCFPLYNFFMARTIFLLLWLVEAFSTSRLCVCHCLQITLLCCSRLSLHLSDSLYRPSSPHFLVFDMD